VWPWSFGMSTIQATSDPRAVAEMIAKEPRQPPVATAIGTAAAAVAVDPSTSPAT
jgi:hypothetical protein